MVGLAHFKQDGVNTYRNDPDCWVLIPKFDLKPSDVAFKGFKYPIFRQGISLATSLSILEMMRAVRAQARSRFKTLSEIETLNTEVFAREEMALVVEEPVDMTSDEMFATRYEIFSYLVARCLATYSSDQVKSLESLAGAGAELAAMMIEKPISADELQKIQADFNKRKNQELAKAGEKGGLRRGDKLRPLKDWAISMARDRRGKASGIARDLFLILPKAYEELDVVDVTRVMRDAILLDRKSS